MLCERYTKGAALLHSLANNMIADMGDIRDTMKRCLACIDHLAHIQYTYILAMRERRIPWWNCSAVSITKIETAGTVFTLFAMK